MKPDKDNNNKGKKLFRVLAACAAGTVILAALALFIFVNTTHPHKVKGLTADITSARAVLSWERPKYADGYYVYRMDGDKPVLVEELEGKDATSWTFEGPEPDTKYVFYVQAYNGWFKNDGKPSEEITVEYRTSEYAQKIPVLAYHLVLGDDAELTEADMKTGLIIRQSDFDEQMKYLHDEGFTTLTMEEFRQWHDGEKEFPEKTCVITFDDGDYCVYYYAYPVLKKYGLAGTVFCIGRNILEDTPEYDPDKEDADHYIGEDVINSVREEYPRFEFESHTYDMHNRIKGKKPAESFTYEQIMNDCSRMDKFGCSYLAYPWGTYSETMQKALKDSGYKIAFTYRPFYYAYRSDDPYAVNRVKISGLTTIEEFKRIVNGEDPASENPDAPENR